MTELLVKEQGSNVTTNLDLSDPRIELNFEIQNNTKLSERSSPHSLSFSLPRTKTNEKFFAHYYSVNATNDTWSAYSETVCEVYDHGLVVLVGTLQLNQVTEEAYSVNVLGTVSNAFRAIRGKSFNDLFVGQIGTDLDHSLTSTNVIDSWTLTNDITNGSVGNGTVVYPLVDHGWYPFGWYLAGDFPFSGLNNNWVVRPEHLKPAVKVAWLFEQIFKYAGYTIDYQSGLTGKDFTTVYMFTGTEQKTVAARPMYGAKNGLASSITITASTPNTSYAFQPTIETGQFFDPDNLFQSGIFTAPFDGTFTIVANIVLTTTATTDYYFSVNAISSTQTFSDQVLVPASANAGYMYTAQFLFTCTQSQQVNFYVSAECGSDVSVATYVSGVGYTSLSVPLYDTDNPQGAVVDMAANMPDLTLDKWLKAIVEKWNIILEYDKDQPTIIYADTAENYFNSGNTYDWSQKVDYSESVVVKPTTELQSKRIIFEDKEGKDHRNEWWQRNWGWVKGRYIYENDNDFAVDEETIGGTFVPLRTQQIRQDATTEQTLVPNVLVSRQWVNSEEGAEQITNKPILAYYNGLKNIGNGYDFLVDSTSVTQYPLFSIYSLIPVSANTVCLNWGYDYPDDDTHPLIDGVPFYFMFRKYWASYINEIYSEESRMMKCKLFLSAQDVRDLSFSDKVYIDESYWRVLNISNYEVSGENPCNVTLLKVIDKGEWECTVIPDDYLPNGTVAFVDAQTGASATATQSCCERFGYKWNTSTSTCHYKAVSGTIGGNPSEPDDAAVYLKNGGDSNNGLAIPNSKSISFNGINVTGSQTVFAMEGVTTSNAYVNLSIVDGGTDIPLTPNMVYGVELDILVFQSGGTGGSIGDVDYMKSTTAVKSVRGSARTVGSFTTLSHQKDHSNVHGVQWNISGGGTREVILRLQVAGQTNHNLQWYVTVKITALSTLKFL
jgi:hypothetical protein